MTTTQITNISHLLDLDAYAGDFLTDYDMDAVRADYLAQLNHDIPDGIVVYTNGDVIAEIKLAGVARQLDWRLLADGIDAAPIFERHDVTSRIREVPSATEEPSSFGLGPWLSGPYTVERF